MNYFVSILILQIVLISCSNPNSGIEPALKKSNCAEEKKYHFDKFTNSNDKQFQQFIHPMDSIDTLIQKENINPEFFRNHKGLIKFAWKRNGQILKMAGAGYIDDTRYASQFYVIDECNWMYTKYKYPLDTLIVSTKHYYSFRDSVVLNSFVTTSEVNYQIMTNLDSNEVSLSQSKTYYQYYLKYQRLFK